MRCELNLSEASDSQEASMGAEKTDFAVLFESAAFLRHFENMPDPRQRGKVAYPLNEILLLSLLAVIAGAETFTEIARFGQSKIKLLQRFLPFANGTPAHDHLGSFAGGGRIIRLGAIHVTRPCPFETL
jgi:hypothetical protein